METENTTEIIEATPLEPQEPVVLLDPEAEQDFSEARATYKELITKGKSALETATNIIEGSEHPRAVEVFGGLLRAISDINDKLIDLQKAKYEMRKGRQVPLGTMLPQGTNITQNNITFGSTQDILAALKTLRNEEKEKSENTKEIE